MPTICFDSKVALETSCRFAAWCCLATWAGLAVQADERLSYNRDIRPILSDKCFACHGLDKNARQADLRLDQRDDATGKGAIVPGKPTDSTLIERVYSHDPQTVMPPHKSNKPLSDPEKELLRRWIEQGAEYEPLWSLIPVPASPPVPPVNDPKHWIRSPIDAFVLQRLQQERLEPAVEAAREKWLRRVSFDLTGLPPTLEELDWFLSDRSPRADESAVDRLLGSSAFGERMANDWLDVSRYADTFGYQADRDTHVWPWRDWVISAFNRNLPYDQFIVWQTAGDLLPDATPEQQLATTFNRLHRQTNEGGSIEEEFRQAYIADRVVTNGTAFLAMTFECARCHDHKYDPISQADFYRMASFFSNIEESGLYSHFTETAPTPAMLLYEGDQRETHAKLLEQIQHKRDELQRVLQGARMRFQQHPLAAARIADATSLTAALSLSGEPGPGPKQHQSFEGVSPGGENRLVPGVTGDAIQFDGDDAFSCKGAGQYGRLTPFTISFWLKPLENNPRIVVLHQCVAAEDAAFRGYALVLNQGQLEFSLVHFWPGDAIQVRSVASVPLNVWTHLTVRYDGSSRADGVSLFMNGEMLETKVVHDSLKRDITYRKEWGDSNSNGVELSLGARFRDMGFRGGAIDELLVYDRELSSLEIARLRMTPSQADSAASPSVNDTEAMRFDHYRLFVDSRYREVLGELRALQNKENELSSQIRQIMVMRESPQQRPTYILKRGAYDARGEEVSANTPASILAFSDELPKNRLGLARWYVDPRNPLTSRVAVNRLWNLLFGRGLVASLEDFGGQGQTPSHPELLDWLARDFMDHGWDVKRFCKQVVLSATYRQSSIPALPQNQVDDPHDLLLARSPRYRLSAEQLRDNALAVSGLLVSKLGGPSVMPYQPVGLWEESGTGKSYHQSKGEGLYRRSMYTFWRRTSPPPSMLTFDATGREVCTARRERTATPLQALVLLNDPQFVEASRVLATRLLVEPADGLESRIRKCFRLLTSRQPTAHEVQILLRLYEEQRSHFAAAIEDLKPFLSLGETPPNESLNSSELAAMTIVVNSVLNFDECVTKR